MYSIQALSLKNIILTIVATLSVGLSLSFLINAATVSAADADIKNSLCQGADNLRLKQNVQSGNRGECADAAKKTGGSEDSVNELIATIINIFSVIVGIIAVVMIIYGGLKFITSGGDSGRLTSAKQTIIYAIIGLIIVALAQFIVRFVLTQANKATP